MANLPAGQSWQPSDIRVQPFGFGNDRKSTYWFFDGSQKIRLYRESTCPWPFPFLLSPVRSGPSPWHAQGALLPLELSNTRHIRMPFLTHRQLITARS